MNVQGAAKPRAPVVGEGMRTWKKRYLRRKLPAAPPQWNFSVKPGALQVVEPLAAAVSAISSNFEKSASDSIAMYNEVCSKQTLMEMP